MAQDYESSHSRSYFHVGGEYLKTSIGHILQNQMYVERLSPTNGSRQPYPIIFIHGACQSGTVGHHYLLFLHHSHNFSELVE